MAGTASGRLLSFTLALLSTQVFAQPVISAHAGLVHQFDGSVLIDGQPLTRTKGRFSEIPEGSLLTTREGKAEILLVPGVMLWLGSNSEVRLQSNSLLDTRLEILNGSAVIESTELSPDSAVSLMCNAAQIQISAASVYRIDASTAEFTVVHGSASVAIPAGEQIVGESQRIVLTTGAINPAAAKSDTLERWALDRMQALAKESQNGTRMAASANPSRKVAPRRSGPYRALMVFVPRRP